LSRVITDEERWIYTMQQTSQWKSPNSPTPEKARQVKSKVKSMLIISIHLKEIVHKEFVLAD
jgi:hypothetical protein